MNIAIPHSTIQNLPDGPDQEQQSFATVLQKNLGKIPWLKLNWAIRARFIRPSDSTAPLTFKGTMQWVYCSPIGWLIARLLRHFAILPDLCRQNSIFEFKIFQKNGVIYKQRYYQLSTHEEFTFSSTFSDRPRLHEEFNGGIGMYLKLVEERGALIFQDQGYFLRIGKWRIRLPRWLTVGSFELLHRNIDANRFQVIIRVMHPLLGTLFYQRGEFSGLQ